MYPWVAVITGISLLMYLIFGVNVSRARGRYKVAPPAMTGSPEFERRVRVHENTLEQLVLFLPALWLFAVFVSKPGAVLLGALWIVGRIVYAVGYYRDASKRLIGFVISAAATVILLLGGTIAALWAAIATMAI